MEPLPLAAQPQPADPAPALGRGIAILRHLEREGSCSLEQLARHFRWPKASLLRLTESLARAGVVVRDPLNKRYRSLVQLVETDSASQQLRARAAAAVAWLVEQSRQTVEVYIHRGDRMVMVERGEPFGQPVTVRARVGFVRTFEEAEAVTLVAAAFSDAPCATMRWAWMEGGQLKRQLDPVEFSNQVAAVRAAGVAWDRGPNCNGVRRLAVPLTDEHGLLAGALAIALVGPGPAADLGQLLTAAAHQIRLSSTTTHPLHPETATCLA
jgi:DNA-binding IclR family transcriptional regulator